MCSIQAIMSHEKAVSKLHFVVTIDDLLAKKIHKYKQQIKLAASK